MHPSKLSKQADQDLTRAIDELSTVSYPEEGAEPAEYVQWTDERWDSQDDAMQPYETVWQNNLDFLAGRFNRVKDAKGRWMEVKTAKWKKAADTNLILPYFRTFLAKTTRNRPNVQCLPASADLQDTQAAQLGEEVIEGKWMELRLSRMYRRAVAWVIATGNAFVMPYWNTDTGRFRELTVDVEVPVLDPNGLPQMQPRVGEDGVAAYDPETGEPEMEEVTEWKTCPCDEDGEPYTKEDGSYDFDKEPAILDQGDIGVKVFSPFHVRATPTATCAEEVEDFIAAEIRSLDQAKKLYPEFAEELAAQDVGVLDDVENTLAHAMGTEEIDVPVGDTRAKDLPKVRILHYFERRSRRYPKGRYWVVAGGQLVVQPQELPDDWWPAFTHLKDVEFPGRWLGEATLSQIVPLNREYNERNQGIRQYEEQFIKGKWLVDRASGIQRGHITTQGGEVIVTNPGQLNGIKQVDFQPLPAQVLNERDKVEQRLQVVSGIHDVSMGKAPPGVNAGVALLQLQEADDSDFGPFMAELEESIAEVCHGMLVIIKNRYSEERLVYVVGPNRRYLPRAFKGADLQGITDVVPVAESSLALSKSARINVFLELIAKVPQLVQDENGMLDSRKFGRMFSVAGLDVVTGEQDIDVEEANREHADFQDMERGIEVEFPEVNEFQNHKVHLDEHLHFIKSAEFRKLSPEIREMMKEHTRQHMQILNPPMPPVDPATGQPLPPGSVPPGAPAPGGPPMGPPPAGPPMDPAMMQPPMDPAMMAPPMDPSMMAPPMDPAMMGAAPPPELAAEGMDPAMLDAMMAQVPEAEVSPADLLADEELLENLSDEDLEALGLDAPLPE